MKSRMSKTMKKILFILSLIIALSGCASLNTQFDCPMKPGIRCESIDSIYARVDRGEIGNRQFACHSPLPPTSVTLISYCSLSNSKPHRYGETVQRVWVAPFEDKEGNYHQESEIYTVVKQARWMGAPLKEIHEEV